MNPAPSTPSPARRSYGRWIIAGLLLLVAPVIIVGAGICSVVTLSKDAAALRREVMTASGSDWSTRVQLDAGWAILGTARSVLHFVEAKNVDDARLALSAVRRASVGVYERRGDDRDMNSADLLAKTDKVMQQRGWSRMVGVVDGHQTVLLYTSDKESKGDQIDLCITVLDGRQMVVVSTRVDAGVLAKLVEKHTPGGLREKLRFAKL
jgi:hypothetical protein